ncbi:hypothetical protein [Paenibacillus sp. 1011MAR3C5]|nr:hypothetical protein [Paenibacillus sp. 1011MAR3C5]
MMALEEVALAVLAAQVLQAAMPVPIQAALALQAQSNRLCRKEVIL